MEQYTPPTDLASSTEIWWATGIAERRIVFLPKAQPVPKQVGTLREQLQIARLAAENPWGFVRSEDAYQAARRTILHHARRTPR